MKVVLIKVIIGKK